MAMKKTLLTVVTAVAWFLPGHLAILALLVLTWGAAMSATANTAKSRATEARLAQHITATAPAINFVNNGGSVGGSVTVNGTHTVTSNSVVNGSHTVNGNLGVQGGTTLVGNSSASNDFTTGGAHTVIGNLGVHGNGTVLGALGVNQLAINNNSFMPLSAIAAASAPPNGTGGASQYAGNFYTGSGAHTWAQDISNKVDAIISHLSQAGVTN